MENNDQQKISIPLFALNLALLCGLIGLIFMAYGLLHKTTIKKNDRGGTVVVNTRAFADVVVQAKAVYVYDIATKTVLYQKNETAQLPLASLTKLMTAFVATNLAPANTQVTIKKEFLNTEGDNGLLSQETWKLKDLLDFSLVTSSNDGARSVASVIGATQAQTGNYTVGRKDFIEKMNTEATRLGLSQTYFINESGLDEGIQQSGGYGSAENVAQLLGVILNTHPEILEATKYTGATVSSLSKNHNIENTNKDISKIPGLIASKTGYTALAGGNLAVVFDAGLGRPVAVVVLGSTIDGRFSDVHSLVNATLLSLQQ